MRIINTVTSIPLLNVAYLPQLKHLTKHNIIWAMINVYRPARLQKLQHAVVEPYEFHFDRVRFLQGNAARL